MTNKLNFRIYDDQGALLGATVYAEDAAFLVPYGGTIRHGRKVVWREGEDHDGEARESVDDCRDLIWRRLGWEAA
jgi:hypothetical protein